ncbi:hypothetical protein ACOSQ2_028234 [Xanthoceras sorbifolium]
MWLPMFRLVAPPRPVCDARDMGYNVKRNCINGNSIAKWALLLIVVAGLLPVILGFLLFNFCFDCDDNPPKRKQSADRIPTVEVRIAIDGEEGNNNITNNRGGGDAKQQQQQEAEPEYYPFVS